ncbi:uncharacterized protein LY89DRAFT_689167 [Mollisia scopiformis]|uniref:rRNA-processing protein n=1 Tax=Mollisia scopiformis TaxID=149040 RepID=A0A194WUJ9_MOLSC|nr:uncharacterized protein LY89DRAFT_689167 [Mollisia scopiformis]KUJ11282.1 hypothetical protein LY89DRAFT_689167 [Mollisia scopiformis]
MSTEVATAATAPQVTAQAQGMRKNGKQWHPQKSAFRPTSGMTSYEKRQEERKATAAVKAKEKEMKEEKEAERQRRITALRDKRAAKEEKARYEKLAETMHRKRVERLKKKEKRNKLLKS